MDAILVEMSKAFDSLPYDKLVEKLGSAGGDRQVILWVRAYLRLRGWFWAYRPVFGLHKRHCWRT